MHAPQRRGGSPGPIHAPLVELFAAVVQRLLAANDRVYGSRPCARPEAGHPAGMTTGFACSLLNLTLHLIVEDRLDRLAEEAGDPEGERQGGVVLARLQRVDGLARHIEPVGQRFGVDGSAVAIAWLLAHPANILPVLGTNNLDRIAAITDAEKVELDRQDWFALFETARGYEVP